MGSLSPRGSTPAAPAQPSTKAAPAAPKLHNEVEMESMPADAEPAQPKQDDLMQQARLGDVAAMEKLFETGGYDATYTDEEGITPLHVCLAQTRDWERKGC
jgi:palmitoyltransferase